MKGRFHAPPVPSGFFIQVWEIARRIPPGKVTTYGRIAEMIPAPPGVSPQDYRSYGAIWVGSAMASCPSDVPWQRVINSQGKISLRKGSGPLEQRQLLEEEGIPFSVQGRVNLNRFGWDGSA